MKITICSKMLLTEIDVNAMNLVVEKRTAAERTRRDKRRTEKRTSKIRKRLTKP